MKAMLENKKIKRLFVFTVALACAVIMALVGIAGYMVYGVSDDAETLYSGTSGTVSWTIYDDGTLYFYPTDGKSGTLATYTSYRSAPWYSYRSYITTIESADGISAGTSLAYFFYNCPSLESVDGLANWDTSSVTTLSYTFYYCPSLENVDALAAWDTSSVTSLQYTFEYCTSLTNVDGLSAWDTSSVTSLYRTFYGCKSLTNVDGLSAWDTSSVTSLYRTFCNCSSLENVDGLSAWDTSSVTTLSYTFGYCTSLTNVDGLASWDTSSVTTLYHTFYYCSSLTDIDALAAWDTSSVTFLYSTFEYCESLTNVDGLSAWDTSKVTDMYYTFGYCTSLTNVDGLSAWDTSSVTTLPYTFYYCTALTDVDGLTNWDVSNVTNMRGLFYYCTSLTSADLSGWTTSSLVYMGYTSTSTSYASDGIFSNCTSLETLDISGFDTSNVTARYFTFYGCDSLSSITLGENWTWGSDYTTPETGSLPDTYSWVRKDDSGTAYGTLTASEFATNWTSDYAGTWVVNITVIIHYDSNGGNGSMDDQSITGADSLTANSFKRSQHKFTGWNTAEDGSGTSFEDGEVISAADYSDEETMTLYAQWEYLEGNYVSMDNYYDPDEWTDEDGNITPASEAFPSSEYDGYWIKLSDNTWMYTFYVYDENISYYVWEDEVDGYTGDYTELNPYYLADGTVVATITNTSENNVATGSLCITKTLLDADGNETEDDITFSIVVTITDEDGNSLTGTQLYGLYAFNAGVANITISAGETIKITDMPENYNYSVEEINCGSYIVSYSNETGVIIADETSNVDIVNQTPASSTLTYNITLTKQLDGTYDSSVADVEYTFYWELTALDNNMEYVLEYSDGTTETITSTNAGTASFITMLKADETIVLYNVPENSTCQITEVTGDDYETSYKIAY